MAASYIRTCCSSAVNIVDLRSYALQTLVGTHCCPRFVRTARLPSTSSTWVRTHCRASLVPTAVLHSYALLVCRQHRRPAFAHVAELRWYPLLSYIRTRCSSAFYIIDLGSHALQSIVGTHCCPIFVRAVRLPSTSSTCIRMCCRSSLVPTAVLHLYALLICRQHR